MTEKQEKLAKLRMLLCLGCALTFITSCLPHDRGCEQCDLQYRIDYVREYSSFMKIFRLNEDGQEPGNIYQEVRAEKEIEEILALLEGETPIERQGKCCDNCEERTVSAYDYSSAYKRVYQVEISAFRDHLADIEIISPCTVITNESQGFSTSRIYEIDSETTNRIFEIAYSALISEGYLNE